MSGSRERYNRLKAKGICVRCGDPKKPLRLKHNRQPGLWCQECYRKTLSNNKKWHRVVRRKAAKKGICGTCLKAKAITGETRCGRCAELNATRLEETYEGRREVGMCPACGEPPDVKGFKMCSGCRRKHAAWQKIRNARIRKERREARAMETAA